MDIPREIVGKVLHGGKQARVPFMPLVCTHAARLEQVTVRKMLSDPALLARAVQNAQKLYNYDMVINVFDPTIEAEACECPVNWISDEDVPVLEDHPPVDSMSEHAVSTIKSKGRLPVIVEATKRLKINLGRTIAVAGVVTGPFTLAGHLNGSDIIDALQSDPEAAKTVIELAGRVCLEVCKSYCEMELDLVVLADSVMPRLPVRYRAQALSVMNPLVNLIRFYNSAPLLLANGCTGNSLDIVANMEVDGIIVDAAVEADVRGRLTGCAVGRAIPSSVLKGPKDGLPQYIEDCLREDWRGLFISTEWQVPFDTPPENLHEIVRLIRGGRG
jgi:uroporphyrinogen decarboxylase